MKPLIPLVAVLIASAALAAEPSPVAKKEIQYLFTNLEGSGCQFNRNGTWHTAQEASGHLQRKYKHLLDKGMISTTESFIDQGAATSSSSGKPYQVRCGGADAKAEASAVWFKAELAKHRQAAK